MSLASWFMVSVSNNPINWVLIILYFECIGHGLFSEHSANPNMHLSSNPSSPIACKITDNLFKRK